MKFNKWTVGLAAVGAVSLASAAQAQDKASGALAPLSSTTLSGYVDTSMQWNLGTGDSHAPAYKYGGPTKADGFNLNAIKVTLEKPLDESEWAAGYKVDLFMGPDADTLGTQSILSTGKSDFAIKQAYVALRAPIGNGLDFKVGVFDSIIGYESTESVNNPNFTRSWGHTFEPSTHTGVLATYRFCNCLAASAGVADTTSVFAPAINGRAAFPSVAGGTYHESLKTYMGSVAFTAPDSWGVISGSSLYGGVVEGYSNGLDRRQYNYYAGLTMATPVTGLRVGAAFDYIHLGDALTSGFLGATTSANARSFAGYASFQATEKLSLHGRFEYVNMTPAVATAIDTSGFIGGVAARMASTTATIQYDLWKNVLSRVEFRWDRALDGSAAFGGTTAATTAPFVGAGTLQNSYILAANVIYKF